MCRRLHISNLFYTYPILNVLAHDFHTSQAAVASIPTLAQAGAATGLLFILPLGDFFRGGNLRLRWWLARRCSGEACLLLCVYLEYVVDTVVRIGLCVTTHLTVFLALTYLSALFTGATQIVTLYPRHPVLVQAALLSFCTFFALTSYWTTLTFLLAGQPYHYNPIDIGLFGLATMVLGPFYGKYIIQPLREPLFSVLVGKTVSLIGIVVGTYTGTRNVAGPVIQAFMLDAGLMIVQIANRMAIHRVEPKGRNRVNTAFVSAMYLGQLTGTKAGNVVYERYGGWVASGNLSVGVIACSYLIVAARGPYEKGWVGWGGGWGRKSREKERDGEEGGGVAKGEVEMGDMKEQERERAARGDDGIDGDRTRTATDDDEVGGEGGKHRLWTSL